MQESAEVILARLQKILLDASLGLPLDDGATATSAPVSLRAMERAYGGKATHYGRLLSDLTEGSDAWELFEDMAFAQAAPDATPIPRAGLLSRCEPLLQLMRASGELAEREHLLREREASLRALWQDFSVSDEEQRRQADVIYARYFDAVYALSETYRPRYQSLRRRESDSSPLLVVPRVRARPLLQPPLMTLLFSACHLPKSAFSASGKTWEIQRDGNRITIGQSQENQNELILLDEMAWDVAALAVSAFFVRTDGATIDAGFPLMIEDYFQWRSIDPRKRTRELRRQVDARIRFLCSNDLQTRSEATLWLPGPKGGPREKTRVRVEGPLLIKRSRIDRRELSKKSETATPDGYVLLLSEWARVFVEERAMIGVFVKRLAEYDLGRQQWERRIGWHLVFQFNTQTAKLTATMKTILTNSHVAWEEMARTNPGKVIRQWLDALETLRADKILDDYLCLDGSADGSDLPTRRRLAGLLERRCVFTPGAQWTESVPDRHRPR